jgi:protein TonB
MKFSQHEGASLSGVIKLCFVALLHGFLAYYVIVTFSHTTIGIFRLPVQTKILEDEKPPPPPDIELPPPSQMAAPPPPYMPPPEVHIQAPPIVNPIAVTTSVPPTTQQFTKTVAAPPLTIEALSLKIAKPGAAPPTPGFADLNSCKPDYPRVSLQAGEQGTVKIQFEIGIGNQLIATKVVKSSGYKNLDKATIDALSHCKFRVGYQDGKPVQSSFTAEYAWKLDE